VVQRVIPAGSSTPLSGLPAHRRGLVRLPLLFRPLVGPLSDSGAAVDLKNPAANRVGILLCPPAGIRTRPATDRQPYLAESEGSGCHRLGPPTLPWAFVPSPDCQREVRGFRPPDTSILQDSGPMRKGNPEKSPKWHRLKRLLSWWPC
jgi:hypothetical protein